MTKPTWKPIQIRLGDLIPWGDNPKYSTKEDARRLLETEQEFGQFQTFSVSPYLDNGKVNCYDGHQRDSAWRTAYGDDFVVWALQSDRHLTDAERRKFVLKAHNAHGQWSTDVLSGWPVDELKSGWMNKDTLKGWNMDALNLREMLNGEAEPIDFEKEWEGMPEFENKDLSAFRTIIVHFKSQKDVDDFAQLINQKFSEKAKYIWFPVTERILQGEYE